MTPLYLHYTLSRNFSRNVIAMMPTDLITTSEAKRLPEVSAVKMAQLIRDGVLAYFSNPLDRREKLVSKSKVEALKPRRAAA